jgi:hypothetical protein
VRHRHSVARHTAKLAKRQQSLIPLERAEWHRQLPALALARPAGAQERLVRIVRMRAAYVQKVHPAVQADREDLANELATAARSGIHEPHGPVHPKVAGPVRPLPAGAFNPGPPYRSAADR